MSANATMPEVMVAAILQASPNVRTPNLNSTNEVNNAAASNSSVMNVEIPQAIVARMLNEDSPREHNISNSPNVDVPEGLVEVILQTRQISDIPAISNLNLNNDQNESTSNYNTITAETPQAILASSLEDETHRERNTTICRYYMRGICRFGVLCRFSHDIDRPTDSAVSNEVDDVDDNNDPKPITSQHNWANAPIFIPSTNFKEVHENGNSGEASGCSNASAASWSQIVSGATTAKKVDQPGSLEEICPFENICPYGAYCAYRIHMELCDMCDQYCLHPSDQVQRKKHNRECLQQHEQAMELSFAIARSKDKTCGICFDTIMEKAGREKRFGILPNCNHIFCLECIRKWRQAKQFEHKISRSCPECRVYSDFVCPSAFWVETKEEKDKLLNDYRSALGAKDCKYFKKGDGKCPFGNKCFYKHALPNGDIIDVGCPKRTRKLQRNSNEIIDLLDIYLWDFVDRRDYQWLELLSSEIDWTDEE